MARAPRPLPPDAATVVWLQPEAPPKPVRGAPCNGCGLCCLAEPCPLGMLVSRRRTGACAALRWNASQAQYRCGLIDEPARVTGWRRPVLLRLVAALARRWVAAGQGCDADLRRQDLPGTPPPPSSPA